MLCKLSQDVEGADGEPEFSRVCQLANAGAQVDKVVPTHLEEGDRQGCRVSGIQFFSFQSVGFSVQGLGGEQCFRVQSSSSRV